MMMERLAKEHARYQRSGRVDTLGDQVLPCTGPKHLVATVLKLRSASYFLQLPRLLLALRLRFRPTGTCRSFCDFFWIYARFRTEGLVHSGYWRSPGALA